MGGEVVHLKGAGGVVWEFTRPLSEAVEHQLTRHELVRVNPDGSPWVESETGEPPAVARPADSALKPEWVGYAVLRSEQAGEPLGHDAADAMTKAELIAKYGD
jgi:hypothetical protein